MYTHLIETVAAKNMNESSQNILNSQLRDYILSFAENDDLPQTYIMLMLFSFQVSFLLKNEKLNVGKLLKIVQLKKPSGYILLILVDLLLEYLQYLL